MERRYWTRTHVPYHYDEDRFDYQVLDLGGLVATLIGRIGARKFRPGPAADSRAVWDEDCGLGSAHQPARPDIASEAR